jgi:hypothetical protein
MSDILNYVGSIVLTVITGYLLYSIKKREKTIDQGIANNAEEIDKHRCKFDDLDGKLSSIIKTNMLNTKNNLMKSFDYYTNRGYVTIDERKHIISMYEDYKDTGGNGITDKIMAKFLDLEVRNPD